MVKIEFSGGWFNGARGDRDDAPLELPIHMPQSGNLPGDIRGSYVRTDLMKGEFRIYIWRNADD